MPDKLNKKHLIALLLIPTGYIAGLMIIAVVESPGASLVTATNPIYIIGVVIGVSGFASGFLR